MASMERDIEVLAEHFEISTEELFDRAYLVERGYLWGISGPKAQHKNWREKNGVVPRYVLDFLRKWGEGILPQT